MGILIEPGFRCRNLNGTKFFNGDFFGLGFRQVAMRLQAFNHLGADGQHRIQCHHWILKDHADFIAPNISNLVAVHIGEIRAVEPDAAIGDTPGLADQVEDGEGSN